MTGWLAALFGGGGEDTTVLARCPSCHQHGTLEYIGNQEHPDDPRGVGLWNHVGRGCNSTVSDSSIADQAVEDVAGGSAESTGLGAWGG
jgi:hypothetical protein